MAAKHIQVAQTEGPKAGFNAWIEMMERSGLPQVKERLAEVRSQGNKKAQFEYYCNVYGSKIFGAPAKNVTNEEVTAPATGGGENDLFALFTQFMQRVGGTQPAEIEDEDDSLDDDDVDAIIAAHAPAQAATTTTTRRGRANTRSSGRQTRSGAATTDDPFAPRNPQDDATSGRLWRLNELGLLQIRKSGGAHITNGDAHEILKQRLS